ncbi:uncharacterized protein LOC143207878 isoform X2 [Lasioglossum baleicum]
MGHESSSYTEVAQLLPNASVLSKLQPAEDAYHQQENQPNQSTDRRMAPRMLASENVHVRYFLSSTKLQRKNRGDKHEQKFVLVRNGKKAKLDIVQSRERYGMVRRKNNSGFSIAFHQKNQAHKPRTTGT